MTFDDATGHKIQSDQRFADPTYVDGQCGVLAYFPPSGSGDAILWPDESPIKGKEATICGGRDPRFIRIVLDQPVEGVEPGPTLEQGAFTNMGNVQSIPIGTTELRGTRINHSFCTFRFNPNFGGDRVLATRVDEQTWRVETQPFPNDKAFCEDGVRGYHLPFAITIRVK